jgi:hypothetical protein
MECYRQLRQASKCWSIPLPDPGWRVCADQEDGAVEVKISSGDPTHPILGGTPLFICYIPLSHKTDKKVVIEITSQTGLLIFVWFVCRIILYNRVIMPFLADKMKKSIFLKGQSK